MPHSKEKSFRYIPGFDGLRALAVLAVIAYHLNIPFMTGGFLGVAVFFVLSGYLITSLLKWEWDKTEKIDLKNFWIRRAKRLLPAMFLLLITLNVLVPLIRPELITSLRSDTMAAIFYYSNWHYIFQNLSYFEAFETTPLLNHFWSLAIEEQFYIVWAVVILLLLKFVRNRKIIFLLLGIGSIFSAFGMFMLYQPNLDPSRVYYGTDTRIFSLLIGACFALISPHQQIKASKHKKWTYEILGIIGFSVFLLMVVYTNQYDSFIYRGGMLLLSITTALLVTSLAMLDTVLVNKILNLKPLTWIGIRSYGIYLWHYPVIMLMNSKINTGGIDYLKIILEITLTFLLASISYTYVEKPIRHGTFRFRVKNSMVIATTIFFLIFLTNSNWVFQKDFAASIKEVQQPPVHNNMRDEGIRKPPVQNNEEVEVVSPPPGQNHDQDEVDTPTSTVTNPPTILPVSTVKITAIGDSVLINPTPLLKEKFPNIAIDAKVSRQMVAASAIVQQLKNTHHLGNIVIIELGTNGPFTEKTLSDLIRTIGKDRKVLLINVRVPRPWEAAVNKRLIEASKKFSNTTVVNWYATSANHNGYFVKDGVHLTPEGAKAYALMIEKAVRKMNRK